jgi:hypothetical protein
VREHDYEPVRGLPERLPAGETILWQGAPDWRVFARRSLHLPVFAAYFALLIGARMTAVGLAGADLGTTLADAAIFLVPSLAALGLGLCFAWLVGRTTIYTITNRRLVMRIGIALPVTSNLPFSVVEAAAVKAHADGSGDLSIALLPPNRIPYLFFWPHVRPWRLARPEPTLRGLVDVAAVAQVLGRALAAVAPGTVTEPAKSATMPAAGRGTAHAVAA